MSNKQTHKKTGELADIKHGKHRKYRERESVCVCVYTYRRKIKPTEKNEYQEAVERKEEVWRLQEDEKCVKSFVITTQPTENVKDDRKSCGLNSINYKYECKLFFRFAQDVLELIH